MTEAKWNACTDPQEMLNFLGHVASDRKLRLFAIACARSRYAPLDGHSATLLELAERFADGDARRAELARAVRIAYWEGIIWTIAPNASDSAARWAWRSTVYRSERKCQRRFLQDIFGNPFRPVSVETWWLTQTVQCLAEGAYQNHVSDSLAILADALEDAGCTNADILNHCRQPGEHVRGCWVIDLLTGRS